MEELGDSQQLYFDKPESKIAANQFVTFWAEDPEGKREVFLDGKKVIYAIPGLHCEHVIHVKVSAIPKPSM